MSEHANAQRTLEEGFEAMGLSLPVRPFMQYLLLLHKWNHAYNLTAIRDLDTMATRHILDSLAPLPWVQGSRILDVGTGAGLPGVPLALAMPSWRVTLLDSNGKKMRFLREVKRDLAMDNIDIVQMRAESYRIDERFDTVVTRAFSDLSQMVQWTHHLLAPAGIWLAMKGRVPEIELQHLPYAYQVKTYQVGEQTDERCCIIIDNKR